MNEIILGTGLSNYDIMQAFHEAHDDVRHTFDESLEGIYDWCEKNIPNDHRFFDKQYYDPAIQANVCLICIELMTSEAHMAFKLRW